MKIAAPLALCFFTFAALAQAPPKSPSAGGDFNLELRREAGGMTVRMQDFFKLMDSLFDHAGMRWDPVAGVLRVEQAGHVIQLLAKTPTLIVDGRVRNMPRPLLLRQGNVLLPVESVEATLKTLGVDFEYNSSKPKAAASPTPSATPIIINQTPTATPTPLQTASLPQGTDVAVVSPTMTPAATASPEPSATPRGEAPMVLPVIDNGPAKPAADAMDLQPPKQLAGSNLGLSWGQLADTAHRHPPSRLVIVCDGGLDAVGKRAVELLQQKHGMPAELLTIGETQRDQDALAAQVADKQPDLLVDLMATPAGPGDNNVMIWTVHDALWPADATAHGDDLKLRYHRHQFQNLALGELLRRQFVQNMPGLPVQFELAPQALLRRTDAPAAAVLIAPGTTAQDAGKEHAATAVAEAVWAYRQGMASAAF